MNSLLTNLLTRFQAYLAQTNLSTTTHKLYLQDVKAFLTFAAEQNPTLAWSALLQLSTFQAYWDHQRTLGVELAARKRSLAALKRFTEYLAPLVNLPDPLVNLTHADISPTKPAPSVISQYIKSFTDYLKANQLSASTIKSYSSDIEQYLNSLATTSASTPLSRVITKKSAQKYTLELVKKHLLSPSTIIRKQKAISRFLAWYVSGNHTSIVSDNQQSHAHSPRFTPASSISHRSRTSLLLGSFLFTALVAAFGFFGYRQLSRDQVKLTQAYPATPVTPNRQLSFQGRLETAGGTPVNTSKNLVFKLWNNSSGGTELYTSGTCSITPDGDGIFNTQIGSTCGSGIGSSVFTENSNVYLEVTVEGEVMSPRQPIATVAYALNSETLQGFPVSATTSALRSTVVVMDRYGEIVVGEQNPKLVGVSGSFTISAPALNLTTGVGTNGNITLAPDGTGQINLTGNTTTTNFLNVSNAQLTTGSLITGTVANNNSGFKLLDLQSGASPASVFSVAASGGITTAAGLTIGTTSLSETTSPTDSGAYLIGVNDEFGNSSSTNLQAVLNDLDAAITVGSGDISAVGSMTSGDVFADATADDDWLGLGATAGRIEFDDQTVDEINFLDAKIGIGTSTPTQGKLEVITSGEKAAVFEGNDGNGYVGWFKGTGAGVLVGQAGTKAKVQGITGDASAFEDLALNPSGGNVGVGTASPGTKFDVNGTARIGASSPFFQSTLSISDNAARGLVALQNYASNGAASFDSFDYLNNQVAGFGYANPSHSVANFQDKVYNYTNGKDFVFSHDIGTSLDLVIKASGSVGIGDATPASLFTVGNGDLFQVNSSGIIAAIDGVAHTLDDVSGNLTLTSNSTAVSINDDLYLSSGLSTYGTAVTDGTLEAAKFCTGDGETNCVTDFSSLSGSANIWTDGGTYTYPTNGEVLGNSTSAGANKLAGLYLSDSAPLVFGTDNDITTSFSGTTLSLTQGNNDINFDSNTLFIDGSANQVGIGTAAPGANLDVAGAAGTTPIARIVPGTGAVTDSGYLGVNSRALFGYDGSRQAVAITDASTNKNIVFDAGGQERLRILSTGNVGIGDTSPSQLFVVGNGDLFQVDSSGNAKAPTLALGTSALAPTDSVLNITDTTAISNTSQYGSVLSQTFTGTATATIGIYGDYVSVATNATDGTQNLTSWASYVANRINAGNTIDQIAGIRAYSVVNSATLSPDTNATATQSAGIQATAYLSAAGTVSTQFGGYFNAHNQISGGTVTTNYGSYSQANTSADGAIIGTAYGSYGIANEAVAHTTGGISTAYGGFFRGEDAPTTYGLYGLALQNSSATETFTAAYGTAGTCQTNSATVTVTSCYGVYGTAIETTGTITNGIAGYFTNSSTFTSSFGVYANITGASTTNYGLYTAVSGGTTNWAVYTSGTTNSYFGGSVGLGTTGPDAKLDSLATTGEQLRLTYTDGSVYTGFTTSATGDLTIDPTGGDLSLGSSDNLNLSGSAYFAGGTTYFVDATGNAKFLDIIAADTANPGLTVGNGSIGFLKVGGSTISDNAGNLSLDSDSGTIQFFSSSNTLDNTGNLIIAGDLRVNGNDLADSSGTTRVTLGATTTLTNTTTTLSGTTTLTASSLATLTTAASLAMSSTTTLTLGSNAIINGGSAANDDLTLQGTSNATRTSSYVILQPSGGSVGIGDSTPDALMDLDYSQTSGTLYQASAPSGVTLAGSLTGLNLDLNTNITNAAQNVTGINITTPTTTAAASNTLRGLTLTGNTITNSSGTTSWTGLYVGMPTLVQSGGTLVSYGMIIGDTSNSPTGTSYGAYIQNNLGTALTIFDSTANTFKVADAGETTLTPSSFDYVFHYNGTTYTDNTTEAKTSWGTAFTAFTLENPSNDIVYFGLDHPFQSVYLDIGTAGAGVAIRAEYWNGSSWNTTSVTDQTSGLTVNGRLAFTLPTDWATTTVNSQTKYWVRICSRSSGDCTTGTGSNITTAATLHSASPTWENRFSIYAQGGDTYPALKVDDSGHVLLGGPTNAGSNKDYKLQVIGSGADENAFLSSIRFADSNSPGFVNQRYRGTIASPTSVQNGDALGALWFQGYAAGTLQNGARIMGQIDGTPESGGDTSDLPTAIQFETSADGSSTLTARMRINPAGYVGVATYAAATANQVCYDTTTISGFNTFATCSSSIRYKQDVTNLTLGLDLIKQFRPVEFTWKKTGERDLGFIAEEMAAINPLFGTYYQGQLEGVKYEQLTAVLALGIQEQQQQLDSLSTHLSALPLTATGDLELPSLKLSSLQPLDPGEPLVIKGSDPVSSDALPAPVTPNPLVVVEGELTAATLSARLAQLQEIEAERLTVKELVADKIIANHIVGLDAQIATLSSQTIINEYYYATATASLSDGELTTIAENLRSRLGELTANAPTSADLPTPTIAASNLESITPFTNTASDSALLTTLDIDTLTIHTTLLALGHTIVNTLSATGSIETTTITSSTQSLALLPAGGQVALAQGTLLVDSQGQVTINGDLQITGQILAEQGLVLGDSPEATPTALGNLLTIYNERGEAVAEFDASGSAQVASLTTSLITIATGATPSAVIAGEETSNATAGESELLAGETTLRINTPFVTPTTLVYLTPATNTFGKVLFVSSKDTGYFEVSIDAPVAENIRFSWWVITTTPN